MAGDLSVPDNLGLAAPVLLTPRSPASGESLNQVVVVATTPQAVGAVSRAATDLLGVDDPSQVTRQSSETLASLRDTVQASLVDFSRALVLGVLGVAGVLEVALLYGFVMIRRKDFGRRRALGATRTLIVTLVLIQNGMLAALGSTLGVVAAVTTLTVGGDPLPGGRFIIATWTLATLSGTLAAVIPAVIAANGDPLTELRVP